MPSVEMRRSTRVFVPKAKDGELVRVLRSGRRLWVESSEGNHKGANQWCPLIDSPKNEKCNQQEQKNKKNGWHQNDVVDDDPMDVDQELDKPTPEVVNNNNNNTAKVVSSNERMIKKVYSRKRKRSIVKSNCGDKKFGLHFVRRQRRKVKPLNDQVEDDDNDDDDDDETGGDHRLLSVFVESSCAGCEVFSRLLCSLLRHMIKKDIGLVELSGFLVSAPIYTGFASSGVHFLWDRPCIKSRGFCRIFGAKKLIPLFTVDFLAVPFCFLHLHATMLFRSVRLSCIWSIDFSGNTESTDSDEPLPIIHDQSDQPLSRFTTSGKDDLKAVKIVNSSSAVGKIASRNVQYTRIGVTTRSGSKRRCRSLRNRRARNPSLFVLQKASGPPSSDDLKRNAYSSPAGSNQVLRRSARKNSASEISVPKSSPNSLNVNVDIDSQCCSANILVVETDKCYRVERAVIMLDVSDSNEWVLAVKKDGLVRYSLKVQREMKPCTTNRFTHALIWAGENGWKLEFSERKNWSVFKELYKVCGERNVVPTSPVVKYIPIPEVCEVTNSWDSSRPPFKRPDSYIRMSSDELSRALLSRTANYDMDSEDEEWLRKFNSEVDAGASVSEETFELMIDAFEKTSFCSPEDCNDEKAAANLCMDLTSSVVAEEVYTYWMKKRKQKRGPLIMLFQYNQPKRAQLITKPVLRKKRSLKRSTMQPAQRGRGKDSSVLQAIAAEQSAAEEQNAISRVEEAKASANRSVELAIVKRQRAQSLMENADLAMYRATMAIRIADAAQFTDSQQAAAHFLD